MLYGYRGRQAGQGVGPGAGSSHAVVFPGFLFGLYLEAWLMNRPGPVWLSLTEPSTACTGATTWCGCGRAASPTSSCSTTPSPSAATTSAPRGTSSFQATPP